MKLSIFKKKKPEPALEYEDIILDITSKLSGDPEKDKVFLVSQIDKYTKTSHPYSLEIIKAIFRLGPLMPDVVAENILSAMVSNTDKAISEAKQKIYDGDLDQAEKIIKSAMPPMLYEEDKVSIYFAFNNPIEKIYYESKFKPKKDIRNASGINTEMFLLYAYILFEKKKFNEAMEILDRGLKYNPLNTFLLFEKGEIFKLNKDWQNFRRITDLCMEYSYRPESVARAQRNYGYMFVELKEYEAAICCYLVSLYYENNNATQNELNYISQVTNSEINPDEYSTKRIEKLLGEKKIQLSTNPELLAIAYALGEHFKGKKMYKDAYSFYSIIYDLTRDEEIKEKMVTIKEQIPQ